MEGCRIGRGGFHFPLVVAAAFLLLLPSPAHATAEAVEYCDKKADYAVKVTGVEISPDPVVRGKPATFRISATTGVSISKGNLVLDVKYFGMHIHKETHDLCKETSCPVSVGDFTLSHDEILPSYAPLGSYTLIMRMIGENGSQWTCINFDFSIGLMSQVADN